MILLACSFSTIDDSAAAISLICDLVGPPPLGEVGEAAELFGDGERAPGPSAELATVVTARWREARVSALPMSRRSIDWPICRRMRQTMAKVARLVARMRTIPPR